MATSDSALAAAPDPDAPLSSARRLEAEDGQDDGLEALRRAANLGQAPAMRALGARLMVGRRAPLDPKEAAHWFSASAELGDAEALAMLATLAAAGVLGPPDWAAALGHLQRAATLGSHLAQGQLLLLANAPAASILDPDGPDTWQRLAEAVDVQAWMSPPVRRPVCESPRVRMVEAFAPWPVCDWLIERARGKMRPAMMYDGTTKTEQVDPHRTCSDYQFDILNTDLAVLLVRERIAALTKLPTVAMEPPRIFHYARGEEIKAHYDRCGDGAEGYGREGGYLGDRIVTFLLYLNDDFDGGDLDFPKAGFRCKGAKGDATYFAHIDPAGKPDPLSLHAGLKVSGGEKWVLSQWIHDRPFGVASQPGP